MELVQIPAQHGANDGVNDENAAIGVEGELEIAQPANARGNRKASDRLIRHRIKNVNVLACILI